jgi:nucleotide-binding universal stress UspA family protein
VRAYAPAGPGRHAVVSWARRQARRCGAPIEIVVDPQAGASAGSWPSLGALAERAFEALTGRPSLVDRLGRAAAGARVLVVPQSVRGVDELVDAAYEAVAVIPDEPPHREGPVVLALAPRTTDEAIEAAFAAASDRGAPLLAFRLRDPVRAAIVTADDAAEDVARERRRWTDHLGAWRIAYPSVPVEVRVSQGDPALELVDLSRWARLLVLGRSGRGRLAASVTPSPVSRVARAARCPVLVVPPPGPPRRPWRSTH